MEFLYLGLLIIVSLFIFVPNVSAQVVINEFSSTDSSDWIEIYNTSSTDVVNLSGWVIKDTAVSSVHEFSGELISANDKWQIQQNHQNC